MAKSAHAIISVSFQSSATDNQAVHKALTGVSQGRGNGPFEKPGTAGYVASGKDLGHLLRALQAAVTAAIASGDDFDSLTVSIVAEKPPKV